MPVPQAWNCTQCGGALPRIEPDEEFVVCGFCKATNAVVRERPLVAVPVRKAASPAPVLIGVAAAVMLASLGAWVAIGMRPARPPSSSQPAVSVAVTLDSTRVAKGQTVQARFAALPASGSSYWAAIAPSRSSDATYGTWAWVDAGATSVSLIAPAPGEYELRLHANYPARSSNVVGRAPFSVAAAAEVAAASREVAEGGVFQSGDRGVLRFEAPLAPRPSEQHWVTVVRAGSPDSEWGDWRYVEAGATSTTVEFGSSGAFEVRLHDGYPRLAHHVILRRHVVVR